jgi:hypothetical protein
MCTPSCAIGAPPSGEVLISGLGAAHRRRRPLGVSDLLTTRRGEGDRDTPADIEAAPFSHALSKGLRIELGLRTGEALAGSGSGRRGLCASPFPTASTTAGLCRTCDVGVFGTSSSPPSSEGERFEEGGSGTVLLRARAGGCRAGFFWGCFLALTA